VISGDLRGFVADDEKSARTIGLNTLKLGAENRLEDSLSANVSEVKHPGKFVDMESGSWFGEACLFEENHVRGETVFARTEAEVAVLLRSDFFEIVRKYPRLKKRHSELEQAFRNGKCNVEELSYNFAPSLSEGRSFRRSAGLVHSL